MNTVPNSSKALDDLRRILLTPEAMTDALEPVLTRLLHERSAQIASALLEELAPAIRLAVREALHEELRELSPRSGGNLALAIESSVVQVFHRQIVSNPDMLAAMLSPAAPPAEGQQGRVLPPSAVDPPTLGQGGTAEGMATCKGQEGGSRQQLRRGWRRFLGFFAALLVVAAGSAFLPLALPVSRLEGPEVNSVVTSAGQAMSLDSTQPKDSFLAAPAQSPTPLPEPSLTGVAASPASSSAALPGPLRPGAATVPPVDSPSLAMTVALTATGATDVSATPQATRPADKVFYLSFDDGPNPIWTPRVLDLLKQYNAKATFFVIGQEAATYPELIQAIANAGHVVANHTWNHRLLVGIDRPDFQDEINRTAGAVGDVMRPMLRPPEGTIDDDARSWAAEMGLQIVKWDIDSRDWTGASAKDIASVVISRARPGKIVLLHDGGGNRASTVAAVKVILETLSKEGYVFRSIPVTGVSHPAPSVTGAPTPAATGDSSYGDGNG